jgi:hypothetical protein
VQNKTLFSKKPVLLTHEKCETESCP